MMYFIVFHGDVSHRNDVSGRLQRTSTLFDYVTLVIYLTHVRTLGVRGAGFHWDRREQEQPVAPSPRLLSPARSPSQPCPEITKNITFAEYCFERNRMMVEPSAFALQSPRCNTAKNRGCVAAQTARTRHPVRPSCHLRQHLLHPRHRSAAASRVCSSWPSWPVSASCSVSARAFL